MSSHGIKTHASQTIQKTNYIVNNVNKLQVKFLDYNVNGLLDKLENSNFVNFLLLHDFICLTETFVANEFSSPLFSDFVLFTSKARKFSHQGRHSGGIVVMIRKKVCLLC
jgi:exonuclease III